jgi:predicted AlkP superfamily phosphohydrolase/phosphomutase
LGSIYVNLRGREPQGIVEPGAEYENVRDEIEHLALAFTEPKSGRRLIGQVLRREDLYTGPHVDRAPDLILRPQDPSDIFFGLADFGHRNTVDTVYRYAGMHRDYGMLIMNGPGIRPGYEIRDAIIHDVAPTVLHTMGLPVPFDMDGKVLEGAFTDDYRQLFPVRFGQKPGTDAAGHGEPAPTVADYTEEGEREILERLQGLGYLG